MDTPDRVAILTALAPRPAGGYSQAIVHGGVVYVAGQLPIDPARGPRGQGELASEPLATVGEQTRRVLANVEAVLRAAGSDLSRVLRCTVYVSDVSLWGEVNRAYCEVFAAAGVGGEGGVPMPARTVVPTGPLHYGYQVEMDVVAAVR